MPERRAKIEIKINDKFNRTANPKIGAVKNEDPIRSQFDSVCHSWIGNQSVAVRMTFALPDPHLHSFESEDSMH